MVKYIEFDNRYIVWLCKIRACAFFDDKALCVFWLFFVKLLIELVGGNYKTQA